MIIGISGKAGAGKDTFADALVANGFVKVSQSDPMKRFVRDVLGFSHDALWGPSAERNRPRELDGLSARHALQTLGTEWGRACREDMWIEYAVRVARELLENPRAKYAPETGVYDPEVERAFWQKRVGVVIPDVRFKNEMRTIQNAGGRVIRIKRVGAGLDGAAASHVSEREQDEIGDELFDGVVVNSGTVAELRAKAAELIPPREYAAAQ